MSFNIREKFRERKFSYKYKNKIDKEKELEQIKDNETKENNVKIVIFSPLIIVGYIRKFINYFYDEPKTIESKKESNINNEKGIVINNKLSPKNEKINGNHINNISKIVYEQKTYIQKLGLQKKFTEKKINSQTILNDRKKKLGQYKFLEDIKYQNNNIKTTKRTPQNVSVKEKQNNTTIDHLNSKSISLENKIILKFKKILEEMDNNFFNVKSEAYLTNKYSNDEDLLKEAVIIEQKIQILIDRLNEIKKQYKIIDEEKFIEDPSILDDSLLIDDIYKYRDIINNCEQNSIPEKLKLLDEYCNLFINLEKLENKIINIKNIRKDRVDELSKRDKKFNNTKIKMNHLDEISENCNSIINKHNKYLEEISNKVKKIDEQKFISYKLKGFNELLSSSLKYLGLLSLSPFRGLIPSIAEKTIATRKLISVMLKNISYEKNEKIVYSVHNYISEIDNKIYDINNVNKNIDNAFYDIQQLKNEFKDYYFKYHLKEYVEVYKKIEKLEEDIIKNKKRIANIRNTLIKNKDENKVVLKKIRKLNNKKNN